MMKRRWLASIHPGKAARRGALSSDAEAFAHVFLSASGRVSAARRLRAPLPGVSETCSPFGKNAATDVRKEAGGGRPAAIASVSLAIVVCASYPARRHPEYGIPSGPGAESRARWRTVATDLPLGIAQSAVAMGGTNTRHIAPTRRSSMEGAATCGAQSALSRRRVSSLLVACAAVSPCASPSVPSPSVASSSSSSRIRANQVRWMCGTQRRSHLRRAALGSPGPPHRFLRRSSSLVVALPHRRRSLASSSAAVIASPMRLLVAAVSQTTKHVGVASMKRRASGHARNALWTPAASDLWMALAS